MGAVGGVGGEGKATEYFMMRIGIPNGLITSSPASRDRRHNQKARAQSSGHHRPPKHPAPLAHHRVAAGDCRGAGCCRLSPKGACGDVMRNVTGCPLAGVAHDELIDASPIAVEAAHLLTANPDFFNLPRKFKVCVTGCPVWCCYPEINDVGTHRCSPRRRGRLLPSRRRRSLHRAAPGRETGLLCAPGSGRRSHAGCDRDIPRPAGSAREPRPRPHEVSLS